MGHRQFGGGRVEGVLFHPFEERHVLFEAVYAALAVLGGVGLDGDGSVAAVFALTLGSRVGSCF